MEKRLIDVIQEKFQLSHKKAKQLLEYHSVYVNKECITTYDYPIKSSDMIKIKKKTFIRSDIPILYEDKDIIVVDKPSGLLTVSTEKHDHITLYHFVREYIKKKNPNHYIFIVHRLDQDTSGIVLFAKSESSKKGLQRNWNQMVCYRGYMALVEGKMKKKKDTLTVSLKENKYHKMEIVKNGAKAITSYQVKKETEKNSLLEVEIQTGKKNQIRATLSYIGHPIVGDKKYGAKTNSIKRLGLHAYRLCLIHPITHKKIDITSPIPSSFHLD